MSTSQLFQSAGALSARALAGLRPDLAARLDAGATPTVVFSSGPFRALVLARAPGGELLELGEFTGDELGADVDAAVASFIATGLGRLPEDRQDAVRVALTRGVHLVVAVEAWPEAAISLQLVSQDGGVATLFRTVRSESRQ